jgi:hypothetical protein
MDPEDLREVISAYQKCVAETVRRFDGFVAKYMGDGVLAYFGYPQAHEDDAERAVRAGLETAPGSSWTPSWALSTRALSNARTLISHEQFVVKLQLFIIERHCVIKLINNKHQKITMAAINTNKSPVTTGNPKSMTSPCESVDSQPDGRSLRVDLACYSRAIPVADRIAS